MCSRNWIYNIHMCFYLTNLLELLFYLFYKLIYRLYYFLNTNFTFATSYTTFIVLIITKIIMLTSLDRRLIIRFRFVFELF
jgi:hypothetical protein